MDRARITLSILFATVFLAAGCQTSPSPAAANPGTAKVEPAARESTPALAPPAATPRAEAEAKPHEATADQAGKAMSTAEMQQRLTDLGYKPGPVDGKAGLRTINALKKFQHDHKLPATGALDAETMLELSKL